MKAFLTKWFTGYRFWQILGTLELILLMFNLFLQMLPAIDVTRHIIVMWVAFATAEILLTINGRTSE